MAHNYHLLNVNERADLCAMPRRPSQQSDYQTPPDTIRLNKYVASTGLCSRRKADELIAAGHIQVNDAVVLEMGYRLKAKDVVKYKGKVISPEVEKVYLLLNKPKNVVTTVSDERGRTTVLDIVDGAVEQRVYPVGRLDRMTTGLLLITNDGDLAKKLTHPSHEVRKVYHVILDEPVTDEHLKQILKGVTLEDGLVPVDSISHVEGKTKHEVGITIHSGKNRVIRRLFASLGYQVVKLDRTMFAGLTKKGLPRGNFRMLEKKEVIMLKHFTS